MKDVVVIKITLTIIHAQVQPIYVAYLVYLSYTNSSSMASEGRLKKHILIKAGSVKRKLSA